MALTQNMCTVALFVRSVLGKVEISQKNLLSSFSFESINKPGFSKWCAVFFSTQVLQF